MGRATFRIDELHIRSFRGIDELRLKFHPGEDELGPLAILAGDNGCGKTSVLEAVLLVLGQLGLLPPDAAPLREQVRLGSPDFKIQAKLHTPGFPVGEAVVEVSAEILSRPPHSPLILDGQVSGDARSAGVWETIEWLKPSVEYFSARREPEALGYAPSPQGARSERESRRIIELKRRLTSAYYRSLRAGQGGQLPEGSPFALLQAFVQRFTDPSWVLDVMPVSNDPGSGDEVIVRNGPVPAEITSIAMARALAVTRSDVPLIVPIDRLSSGQVALFAFAGPLVFRDAPADVVLLDEPEQHMHVQWQRFIVGALRELSPESQFIVATHSLDVLGSALSYERLLLLQQDDPRARSKAADVAAE